METLRETLKEGGVIADSGIPYTKEYLKYKESRRWDGREDHELTSP